MDMEEKQDMKVEEKQDKRWDRRRGQIARRKKSC